MNIQNISNERRTSSRSIPATVVPGAGRTFLFTGNLAVLSPMLLTSPRS